MRSDFVSVLGDDAEYAAYLDEQGFPKSYQPYLRPLHAASGGKWNFVANQTGLDWGRALENESTLGRALIDGSNTALRSTAPGAYDSSTGVWRQYESGWYAANEKTVAYYLDPRSGRLLHHLPAPLRRHRRRHPRAGEAGAAGLRLGYG